MGELVFKIRWMSLFLFASSVAEAAAGEWENGLSAQVLHISDAPPRLHPPLALSVFPFPHNTA